MKKLWLSCGFALFLLLAPAVLADDGSVFGSFEQLLDRLIALFLGDEPEIGSHYPPYGDSLAEDEPEIGDLYPPYG